MAKCPEGIAACFCSRADDHDEVGHLCECGGSWSEDETTFTIWALPGSAEGYNMDPLAEAFTYPLVTQKSEPMRVNRGGISYVKPPPMASE